MTIAEITAGHLGHIRPDGLVVVETHHKMVLDEVLAAHTNVEGIPVVELVTKLGQFVFGNSTIFRVFLLMKRS